jgi:hypothetical protein
VRRLVIVAFVALAALAGCGKVAADDPAKPPPPAGVVAGAARMQGGRFTMDALVGGGSAHGSAQNGSKSLSVGAVKTP